MSFKKQLQSVVEKVNKHDMVIIVGDMNAKVGACNKDKEQTMGIHGTGTPMKNGERQVESCGMNKYVITGTWFPHNNIKKKNLYITR